jgi:regulator of sigma E protease
MGYLLVVTAIALLILAHEVGHFVAARWAGIPVARFSIGFGPRLWGFTRGGTQYCLSAIPLGGYVLLAMEDEREFFRVPLRQRIAFALGGPLANFLVPVGLFMALNVAHGLTSPYDIVIAPFLRTWDMTVRLLVATTQIAVHPNNLSGLVGIVVGGGQAVGTDLSRLLQFSALLSLNLAVFNLLPIPILDGGRVVLGLLEKVHARAAQRLYVPLCVMGLVLLVSLIAYATVADILRLAA